MESQIGVAYGHVNDVSGPAPGDLELVRSFVSLHDHPASGRDSLPPSPATIEAWFRDQGLLDGAPTDDDLAWALSVHADLRSQAVGEGTAATRERLNEAARRAGITICFGCADTGPIHATAGGVAGAVGRLLGISFLAERDGTWERLRACANDTCRSVFWDRSKNRSGRWCSMRSCGNQAKVRAFRQRERAAE